MYKRFYHMFLKGELDELVAQVPGHKVEKSYFDHANWAVVLRKDEIQ